MKGLVATVFSVVVSMVLVAAAAHPASAAPISNAGTELGVDWVSAGVGGLGPDPSNPAWLPATITVAGVTGTVSKALLYWHGMDSTVYGGDGVYDDATVLFNGNSVTGVSLGDAPTNCWGGGSSRAFRADVTAYVGGNGNYTIDSFAGGTGHSGNGASLVVIFDDGNPGNNRDLVRFEGNDSNKPDGFPGETDGWHGVLPNINYGGGTVKVQLHVGDGQNFTAGLDDNSLTFTSDGGPVAIPDALGLWDGDSVPNAGHGRAANGALWDIHTFDVSAAFGAPGSRTLYVDGQSYYNDCLGLIVLLVDLEAGSIVCGNGVLDPGEQCDDHNTTPGDGCDGACQLETATTTTTSSTLPSQGTACCSVEARGCIDVESESICRDVWVGTPLGPGSTCSSDGYLCESSSTTTMPPPQTEACCVSQPPSIGARGGRATPGGCIDAPPDSCALYNGTSLGPGTSCKGDGYLCLPSTTSTLPPTTTTLPPPTTSTTTTTTTSSTTTSTTLSNCGDGVVAGLEECDDGGTATGDGCDDQCQVEECWSCDGASPTTCTALDGVPCDDGDVCTIGDVCDSGTCSATVVAIRAACDWVLIGGDPAKRVRALTKEQSEVNGDICADRLVLGELTQNGGDVVATEATFRNGLRISPNVTVVGDVVTAGGGVRGKPRGTLLPGLAVDEVAGGSTVVKDPSSNYSTTGTHAQVAACDTDAQDGVDSGAAFLLALPSTATLGNVKVSTKTGPLTISPATVPGVTAGGVNVIDFGALRVVTDGVLTLDAGGDPTTVYVLRVADKMVFALRSQLAFANGQLPANTIVLANSKKCHIGLSVSGGGVIVCPNGALKLNAFSTWDGALLGGKGKVFVGQKAVLNHVPFLGL